MEEISGDPSGTDPALYLNGEELETLDRFIGMVEGNNDGPGWPDAEPIIHMRSAEGVRAWTSSMNIAKSGLFKALLLPKTGDTQLGYVFARLNIMPTQQVAICKDGKLRSKRGHELIRSNGVGWGALPDPVFLAEAIKPTNALLNYDSRKHIAASLMSRIMPGSLPSVDR